MTLANDLVQFLMHLFGDRQAAQDFLDDPEKVLEDHGLGGVCSADVDAAMPVVLDYAPVSTYTSRFDREYNTGGNTSWTGHIGGGGTGGAGHTPPPGGGHGGGHHDHDDHAHAVQQLHHVVNNYSYTSTVDDRDNIVDQSVNQNVWAEGDVEQWFDNDSVIASGDRSIAAGDDANVRDSNNISDSYNTDNSADNSTDNSVHAGGDVNIGNEKTDIDDSFNTDLDVEVADSFNDNSDNSVNDSYNDNSDTTTELDVAVEDSFNDNSDNSVDNSEHSTDVVIEDSFQDNSTEEANTTEVVIEDSFQDNSTEETDITEVVIEDSFQDNSTEETDTDVNVEAIEANTAIDDSVAG